MIFIRLRSRIFVISALSQSKFYIAVAGNPGKKLIGFFIAKRSTIINEYKIFVIVYLVLYPVIKLLSSGTFEKTTPNNSTGNYEIIRNVC